MTLILQSAFDHNGAFHRDPDMTRVITEPSSHSVMIEGADIELAGTLETDGNGQIATDRARLRGPQCADRRPAAADAGSAGQ